MQNLQIQKGQLWLYFLSNTFSLSVTEKAISSFEFSCPIRKSLIFSSLTPLFSFARETGRKLCDLTDFVYLCLTLTQRAAAACWVLYSNFQGRFRFQVSWLPDLNLSHLLASYKISSSPWNTWNMVCSSFLRNHNLDNLSIIQWEI